LKSELITNDEQGTLAAGIELASRLRPGDCIALEGMLGAGKTCLARGIAIGLGIAEQDVASPTFALVHEHACTMQDAQGVGMPGHLYHLDAYRLGGIEDLQSIGWEELLDDPAGIMVIEWASRIRDALPPSCIRIELEHRGETERGLRLLLPDGLVKRLSTTWDPQS
jgi:tRNA threonylcarbamoyladenosine biosynthesis protein TsaE